VIDEHEVAASALSFNLEGSNGFILSGVPGKFSLGYGAIEFFEPSAGPWGAVSIRIQEREKLLTAGREAARGGDEDDERENKSE
jgi:hypothetical protein